MRSLFLVVLFCLSNLAYASSSPKQVVESVIEGMKQGSVFELLRHVHWSSAYEALESSDRKKMGIASAEELRVYFEKFFAEPDAFLREQVSRQMANLPPEHKAVAKQRMIDMQQIIVKMQKEMSDKMKRSSYDIGEVKEVGDEASVEVVAQLDGEVKRRLVMLRRIQGEWFFPSADWVQEHSREREGH